MSRISGFFSHIVPVFCIKIDGLPTVNLSIFLNLTKFQSEMFFKKLWNCVNQVPTVNYTKYQITTNVKQSCYLAISDRNILILYFFAVFVGRPKVEAVLWNFNSTHQEKLPKLLLSSIQVS